MKEILRIEPRDDVILLGTDLVYGQRPHWCSAGFYPLKMSLLRPRTHFPYDPAKTARPCLVFLCGGGWTEVDNNVWIPELVYFAKQGYVVASVAYSLSPTQFHPEPLVDVKLAIRYLRAHAQELGIDADRIAVMGESAGGYFAAMAAVTGETREFDRGDYQEQSSAVRCAIPWYPCVDLANLEGREDPQTYRDRLPELVRGGEIEPHSLYAGVDHLWEHPELAGAVDPRTYVTEKTPPMLLLHGSGDTLVPLYNSEALYETLQRRGVPSDLVVVEDAHHADARFLQQPVKERILRFLREYL